MNHELTLLQTPFTVQELIEALQNPAIEPTNELNADLKIMPSVTKGGIAICIDEDSEEVWQTIGQDHGQG